MSYLLVAHGITEYNAYGIPHYSVSCVLIVDGLYEAQEEAVRLAYAIGCGVRVDITPLCLTDVDLSDIPFGAGGD